MSKKKQKAEGEQIEIPEIEDKQEIDIPLEPIIELEPEPEPEIKQEPITEVKTEKAQYKVVRTFKESSKIFKAGVTYTGLFTKKFLKIGFLQLRDR